MKRFMTARWAIVAATAVAFVWALGVLPDEQVKRRRD